MTTRLHSDVMWIARGGTSILETLDEGINISCDKPIDFGNIFPLKLEMDAMYFLGSDRKKHGKW